MRLYSFKIRNFKSIIDTGECKISDIDNIVILAGQNESGKSSVLEGLDFFANGPSDKFVKLQKRQGTDETEATCRFIILKSDLPYLLEKFKANDDVVDFLKNKEEVILTRSYEKGIDSRISIDNNFFNDLPKIKTENGEGEEGEEQSQAEIENYREDLIKEISEEIIEIMPTFSLYSSFYDLLPSEQLVTELQGSKAIQDFEEVFDVNLKDLAGIVDTRDRRIKIMEDFRYSCFSSYFKRRYFRTVEK